MILAGDIGGTKTVLALYDVASNGAGLSLVRETIFKSAEHQGLEEILTTFLHQEAAAGVRAGCFGVPGAVIDGHCRTTNLPWELDEKNLSRALRVPRVKLLNDLEATAFGMLHLAPSELHVLNVGIQPPRHGNVAVIAAGTGLGEAMLYWDGLQHHPLASEGGHVEFGPRSDLEIELLQYLRQKIGGHISYERVLSGPGFYNIFTFLRDSGHYPEGASLAAKLQANEPNAVITQEGLAGEDPLCVATLDLFASIYGAEAGNLALKCVGIGGVYVGGGIAPKMLPALQKGSFMSGFTQKGRFTDFMKNIPVRVALNQRTPLLGAAHFALRL
jgi:glucokinase